MLRRVFHFFAGILIAGMTMTAPARAAEFEITPFIGYTGGGDFNYAQTGGAVSFDDTSSYGIMLDFKQAEDSWIELYYSRQQTRLTGSQGLLAPATPLFDVDMEYYHLGGTYGAASGMVRPFVVGTVGATRMVPQGDRQSETKFSLSLGGGARFYLTKHVGLRLDARWFGTFIGGSGSVFCSGGACLVEVEGSVLSQFSANAGVILAF